MAASVTTLTILDGNGTPRTVQALDLSGSGAGPFSFINNIVDGAGVNLLEIDSTGRPTVKLNDGSGNTLNSTAGALNVALTTGSVVVGEVVLATGTNSIGSISSITNPVSVVQTTASNLNATVVGTGTFATQAVLTTGTAAIGTVSITTGSASIGTVSVVQTTASNLNATVVGTGTFATQTVLTTGTAAIGTVSLTTGTAAIGSLTTGTAAIGTVSLTTGTASIGTVASITNAVTVAQATASNLNATVVGTGTFVTQSSLTTGTAAIGSLTTGTAAIGTVSITTGTAAIGNVSLNPQTANGLSVSSTILATGTNATAVKASAGQLYSAVVTNNSATIGYLKIYNLTTATAGSNTPVIRIMVPGNSSGAGVVFAEDIGIAFSTGISYAFTGGIADSDTTSVTANVYIVNIFYK